MMKHKGTKKPAPAAAPNSTISPEQAERNRAWRADWRRIQQQTRPGRPVAAALVARMAENMAEIMASGDTVAIRAVVAMMLATVERLRK